MILISAVAELKGKLVYQEELFLRILKALKHHAYHITLVEQLQVNHFQQRIVSCQWAMLMIENDTNCFNFVLFRDEAKFQSDGKLNTQ